MSTTEQFLAGNHDLSLPDWGPYSKRFFGCSHIAHDGRGSRFDFLALPGIYRREFGIPDALRPARYQVLEAAPNLEYYAYRQQLEWRDKLYCDIAFSRIDDATRKIRAEFFNNTALQTDFSLHLVSLLELDPGAGLPPPPGGIWLDALEHVRLDYARSNPRAALTYDAVRRGEIRVADAVGGGAIRLMQGDRLQFNLPEGNAKCFLRCRAAGAVELNEIPLVLTDTWSWIAFPFTRGTLTLTRGEMFDLDGIFFGDAPPILSAHPSNLPEILPGPTPHSAILRYQGVKQVYGIAWDRQASLAKLHQTRDLIAFYLYEDLAHQSYLPPLVEKGARDRFFDVALQPLPVAPGESTALEALLTCGDMETVRKTLMCFPQTPEAAVPVRIPKGPYAYSQQLMSAITLTNVVYPIRMDGQRVRHHTPGRRWNSLYTWDSGFTGLGLLELDFQRALENLNAYLTEPGDPEKAFIHHGSLVPVQFFLFFELWNRGGADALPKYFYPRLKQYYEFMAGRHPGSFTGKHSAVNLLAPWDYFYNSGGWDDYPAQHIVHTLRDYQITPVVTTSMVIRCARFLRTAARELGFIEDEAMYNTDIERFSEALQRHAWDPECGYFGYVRHDAKGNPTGLLRAQDGSNLNCGLDGTSPLIAGGLPAEQRKTLYAKLADPEKIWTPVGLSTVDQSASYFRLDGYWNGSVWFPHQWFYWKAALSDGEAGFAWKIARTALDIWKQEVDATGNCYEHFSISSGRGSGWHHFSGLSTPVLAFYNAYYQPETLTAGFDVRIVRKERNGDKLRAELVVEGSPEEFTSLLITGSVLKADCDGSPAVIGRRDGNTVELRLPKGGAHSLEITFRK